jgi:hypothetical protein
MLAVRLYGFTGSCWRQVSCLVARLTRTSGTGEAGLCGDAGDSVIWVHWILLEAGVVSGCSFITYIWHRGRRTVGGCRSNGSAKNLSPSCIMLPTSTTHHIINAALKFRTVLLHTSNRCQPPNINAKLNTPNRHASCIQQVPPTTYKRRTKTPHRHASNKYQQPRINAEQAPLAPARPSLTVSCSFVTPIYFSICHK